MSVQVNTYIILGVKFPYPKGDGEGDKAHAKYEQFDDDAFHPRQNGFVVLFDGMNGEYIIAGNVMAVTDEGQHFDDPIPIDPPSKKVLESIKRDLKQFIGVENPEIKYWVVSHHR